MSQETKNSPALVLLSGGVDSALLLQFALRSGRKVIPLYVANGFIWEEAERHWLEKLLHRLASPRLHSLRVARTELHSLLESNWAFTGKGTPDAASPDEAVYLPGRNLVLFSLASLACHSGGAAEVWIGSLKHNPFSDTTPEFFKSFEETAQEALHIALRIQAPFREWEKSELIRKFPDFPYELTFSCIKPHGFDHCGECNKCEERRSHLRLAGIEDKTNYRKIRSKGL